MSAQAGVLFYDERPIDRGLVTRLGHLLDDFGPDRSAQHVEPGLAVVHRALHVTPEDKLERQPIVSSRGNVMTWDGRLDNRADLMLQLWHDIEDDTSDAALAMLAYDKWGFGALTRLIGDWSLVVWDADTQSITLASDYMGVRPLHYHIRDDSVWWSTTLESLVAVHDLYDELDPRFIAGCLTVAWSPNVTPYRGIASVPAGHAIIASRHKPATAREFYSIRAPQIRYSVEADYAAHLRTLFMDAVGSRLRAAAPAWAHLSGGLDSSSIVCAADTLIKRGLVASPTLSTISYVTDGSPETDERRFIACVEDHIHRKGHHLQLDDSFNKIDTARSWVTPVHPSGSAMETYQVIRRSGGRVLLTGVAGDSVMGNCLDYHYDVAGQLRDLCLAEALTLARQRALAARRPIISVLYDACRELLPARFTISRLLQQQMGVSDRSLSYSDEHFADVFLLKPEYATPWREEQRRQLHRYWRFPDVSMRRPARELIRVADGRHAQSPSEAPQAFDSHPYLHRPLVEFMLGIPARVVAPPGEARGLMRRAFEPFVPRRIISRISKGYAPPFFARNLRATVSEWLDQPTQFKVAQLECIDHKRLMQYLQSVRDNTCKRTATVVTLVKLEQWLRARELRSRTDSAYSTVERR
jgi:asparagine synthase (glutamine-hydrolysing)